MASFIKFCFYAAIGLVLATLTLAQQYAGDNITNTLPTVPGSELTFFRIADPARKNDRLTLVNYQSLQQNGRQLDPESIQRAVVVIHGLNQDPGTYMAITLSALNQETSDPNVNFSSVAIMAPYFANGDDKGTGYPWSSTSGSTSNCLVWKGSQWSAGGDNQYPKSSTTVSSFEVLDQVIKYWDNSTTFPNLKHIVIAGHSLGAQAVARYVQIGNQIPTTARLTFWIGNPNNFAWMNTSRPISSRIADCPTYDNYRDGYTNFTQYPMTYAAGLVASGRDAIVANMQTRSKIYVRGTLDFGDTSSNCNPFTAGLNRNERFFNFIKAWPPTCESTVAQGHCDLVDYVPFGHDAGAIFASPAGRARFFTDNFYGDGKTAPDFGYPRKQPGDDPYPNPTLANSTQSFTDMDTYGGNMTYAGCWSDDFKDIRALNFLAYDNSSNSPQLCTSTCRDLGYAVAALEYGSQCFCGQRLSGYSAQTIDLGCSMACPGDGSKTCGASYRVSVYSAGPLKQNPVPASTANVENYSYYNCIAEAKDGRVLGDKGYADDKNMTLSNCADFCQGYAYFGTQYSSQCFCGKAFTGVVNITSPADCYRPCTGNAAELCGGTGRLSVYSMAYPLPVPSSTTITTSAVPTTTTVAMSSSSSTTSSSSSMEPSSSVSDISSSVADASSSAPGTTALPVPSSNAESSTAVTSNAAKISVLTTSTSNTSSASSDSPVPSSTLSSSSSSVPTTTKQTPSSSAKSEPVLSTLTSAMTTQQPATTIPGTITTKASTNAAVKTTTTSIGLTWKDTCSASCYGSTCSGFRPSVLAHCATKIKSRLTTTTLTSLATATKNVVLPGKVATVIKTRAKTPAKTSATTTTTRNLKATCSGAPALMTGYNCAQVAALCECQVLTTTTAKVTKVVTTVTLTQWPKATKTTTVTVG